MKFMDLEKEILYDWDILESSYTRILINNISVVFIIWYHGKTINFGSSMCIHGELFLHFTLMLKQLLQKNGITNYVTMHSLRSNYKWYQSWARINKLGYVNAF